MEVPSFSSIVRATPDPIVPTGAVVGASLSQGLATLGASAANAKSTKNAIAGFADAIEGTDPTAAALYRSMANSIPALDPSVLLGSSGGSSARGAGSVGGMNFSGMTGTIMEHMLDTLKVQQQKNAYIELDAAKTANAAMLAGLQTGYTIREIEARGVQDRQTLNLAQTGPGGTVFQEQMATGRAALEAQSRQQYAESQKQLSETRAATEANKSAAQTQIAQMQTAGKIVEASMKATTGQTAKGIASMTNSQIDQALAAHPDPAVREEIRNLKVKASDSHDQKARVDAEMALDAKRYQFRNYLMKTLGTQQAPLAPPSTQAPSGSAAFDIESAVGGYLK